jgi:hypothetical protein
MAWTSAKSKQIRAILVNEQKHQIDLVTALGKDLPTVIEGDERALVLSSRPT